MGYTPLIKEVNIPALVKALRDYSEVAMTAAVGKLVCDAAATIEALQAEVNRLEHDVQMWKNARDLERNGVDSDELIMFKSQEVQHADK